MSSLITQLLIALLCATLGFIAGVLVTILWSERDKQRPDHKDDVPEGLDEKRHEPLASLWRDRDSGNLITEINGKAYTDEKSLNKSQRNDLKRLAMNWAGWIMGSEEKPETEKSTPPPQPATPPPTIQTPPILPQAVKEAEKGKKGEKVEEVKPKTMVEEIDEIAQGLIKGTPIESRGVRIMQEKMGIVVWVGLDHFDGIDAVADPDIKAVLRKAVIEWEQRQEQKK